MKTKLLGTLTLMSLIFSASAALAADTRVLLNAEEVTINTDRAVLVRTAETPKSIKVHMDIPFGNTVCVRYEDRMEFGPDSSCGYERYCRTECGSVCEVWKDGHCVAYGNSCWESCTDHMRSCYHTETYCVETGVSTSDRSRSFRLKFKNVAKLAAGEEETFEIQASQNHTDGINDVYNLEVKSSKAPYTVKTSEFLGDWITVKGKK